MTFLEIDRITQVTHLLTVTLVQCEGLSVEIGDAKALTGGPSVTLQYFPSKYLA